MKVTLPTEEQWDNACLAGSGGEFHYSGKDFSKFENMADKTFATKGYRGKLIHGHFEVALDVDMVVSEGFDLANREFNDGYLVTVPAKSLEPIRFGLHHMHGNVAEWVLNDYNETEKW